MGLTVLDAGVLIGFLDGDDHHHQAARMTLSAPLDEKVAIEAARLRATHRPLRLPDALVIATAITLDSERLVTTDRGWPTRRRLGLRAALSVI